MRDAMVYCCSMLHAVAEPSMLATRRGMAPVTGEQPVRNLIPNTQSTQHLLGHHARSRSPFHRDHSLVVLNVALNDDFDGAHLLFALDGCVVQPVRRQGDATAHTCATVHGVSRLAAGVRYNFFVTFEAAARPAPSA